MGNQSLFPGLHFFFMSQNQSCDDQRQSPIWPINTSFKSELATAATGKLFCKHEMFKFSKTHTKKHDAGSSIFAPHRFSRHSSPPPHVAAAQASRRFDRPTTRVRPTGRRKTTPRLDPRGLLTPGHTRSSHFLRHRGTPLVCLTACVPFLTILIFFLCICSPCLTLFPVFYQNY